MNQSVLKKIDAAVLGGFLFERSKSFRLRQDIRRIDASFGSRHVVHHEPDAQSLLARLCDKYPLLQTRARSANPTAPMPGRPTPTPTFTAGFFGHCRDQVKRVFECGLGSCNHRIRSNMGPNANPGASLRVLEASFPHAEIVGGDIDKAVLFTSKRIRTYHLDQCEPASIAKFFKSAKGPAYDLMIDDGLHTFDAAICLFEHSFKKLKAAGIYVIEDVETGDTMRFKAYFSGNGLSVDYINLLGPHVSTKGNNLILVRRVQLR